MNNIKWLLFDLGGVLAEYVGTQRICGWMRNPISERDLYQRWLFSPSVRAFESGRMSPELFAAGVIEELGLAVRPDEFLREFPNFVTGYYPGAEELLGLLSAKYPLALLSNTNAPQWGKLLGISKADRLFQRTFLSFETGLMKPDAEAYANVVRELGCAPGEILFFDDNPHNVQGALEAGMRVERVEGFEGLRETVGRMGLNSK